MVIPPGASPEPRDGELPPPKIAMTSEVNLDLSRGEHGSAELARSRVTPAAAQASEAAGSGVAKSATELDAPEQHSAHAWVGAEAVGLMCLFTWTFYGYLIITVNGGPQWVYGVFVLVSPLLLAVTGLPVQWRL